MPLWHVIRFEGSLECKKVDGHRERWAKETTVYMYVMFYLRSRSIRCRAGGGVLGSFEPLYTARAGDADGDVGTR